MNNPICIVRLLLRCLQLCPIIDKVHQGLRLNSSTWPTEEELAVLDPKAQLVAALHIIPDWTVPYLAYMTRDELPEDETLARQIVRRSKSMTIVHGELHHRSQKVCLLILRPLERSNHVKPPDWLMLTQRI